MRRLLLLGVFCASAVVASAARGGDIQGLGGKYAQAISGNGSTVVGYDATTSTGVDRRTWKWTATEGKTLLAASNPGIQYSWPAAVSFDGSAVALNIYRTDTFDYYDTARWTAPSKVQSFGQGITLGISPDGALISGRDLSQRATLWDIGAGGASQQLSPGLPGFARAVSANGQVIVGDLLGQAVRWVGQERRMEVIAPPPGRSSAEAFAVSADGSTVFGLGWGNGSDQAWRWTAAGGTVALGNPPGWRWSSGVLDATADGQTAVGIGLVGEEVRPFIWDSRHGIRDLERVVVEEWGMNLGGWRLTDGNWDMFLGISDDGRTLTGIGMNPQGQIESWIATVPAPEPSSAGLVGIAAAGLLRRRRDQARWQ
jgi:hypothetical protein